jgi:hypothetical protein
MKPEATKPAQPQPQSNPKLAERKLPARELSMRCM